MNFRSMFLALCALAPASIAAAAPTQEALETQQTSVEAGTDADADAEDKGDDSPMGWLGIGVKVGFGAIHSSDISNPAYNARADMAVKALPDASAQDAARMMLDPGGNCGIIDTRCTTPGRRGMYLAFPISLGGDGFGWDIEPYFQNATGVHAVGAYTGPKFDIHIAKPLYLGFGFGLKAAWLKTDHWDYGMDIYGRIPVRATLYLFDDFAFVFELGYGAGATGYASKSYTATIPGTNTMITTTPSLTFGHGNTWDASVGFRFP